MVSQLKAPAATSITACETISRRRRSTISASAPAGSASRRIGRLDAVWMRATISGDGESEVISQAAPTFCIQVPMLETRAAIQSQKNRRCERACQMEAGAAGRGGTGRAPSYATNPLIEDQGYGRRTRKSRGGGWPVWAP